MMGCANSHAALRVLTIGRQDTGGNVENKSDYAEILEYTEDVALDGIHGNQRWEISDTIRVQF